MTPIERGVYVVVVDPETWTHRAQAFWKENCRVLKHSEVQFIGLDGDHWETKYLLDWVRQLRDLLSSRDPQRLLLTTIVVMAWPQDPNKADLESLSRFHGVVLAGANLRMKRAEYYGSGDRSFLECFTRDLQDAGLLLPLDERPTPEPYPEPRFATAEEEENYRQRMAFYADPPFKWHPDDLAALFESE